MTTRPTARPAPSTSWRRAPRGLCRPATGSRTLRRSRRPRWRNSATRPPTLALSRSAWGGETTMTAAELLADLRRQGFTPAAVGADIQVSPYSRLTDRQRQDIRDRKAELLALLQHAPAPSLLDRLLARQPGPAPTRRTNSFWDK